MELLERGPHLEELARLLHLAASGQGCCVFLGGEAGVGKSSLLTRLCHDAGRETRVLWGACDPLSTPRPLGPLLDMADALGGDVPHLIDVASGRDRLFGAVLTQLANGPVRTLVAIEDAHWADEATFDLLRYLGRRIEPIPVMLVVTYRDDEVDAAHPLRRVLGDLATARAVRRLALPPLSVDAVRILAAESAFDPVALHRQTGGNPFYLSEVLAAGGLSATVRDAVLTRASRLSPVARTLLDAAAVIGSPIDPTLASQVAACDVEAIEECLAKGLLCADGQSLRFRHELARQAVLDAISPLRLTALHASVLRALEAASASERDLARLAHHAEGARDRRAVLAYAPAAAQRAAALRAHKEAADQAMRALRFADGLADKQREPLLEAIADACYLTGQTTAGIAAREELIEIARRSRDREKEAIHLTRLSAALVAANRTLEAEQPGWEAIEALSDLPVGTTHAQVFRTQAFLRMVNRDCADAVVWGRRAISLAERFGEVPVLVGALSSVGSALIASGDVETGCAEMERGLRIARESEAEQGVLSLLSNMGTGLSEVYRFPPAERYLTEGISYASDRGHDGWRDYMTAWLASTHLFQGRWAEATDLTRSVLNHPSEMPNGRTIALTVLGRLRARRGDPETAIALDEALGLGAADPTLLWLGTIRAARAEAAWLAGDVDTTRTEAGAVFDRAIDHQHAWFAGELAYWLWRADALATLPTGLAEPFALQIAGDWRGAAAVWDDLGCPYESARALAEGDDEDALRQALATFDRLGARPMAVRVTRHLRGLGVRDIPRGPRPATLANAAQLTAREYEILGLIAGGRRNGDIAESLFLSPKTVERHLSAVFTKLGVANRAEAVREATRRGLIPQSEGSTTPT